MQRVPATEAQGRIHTSTATVAVFARGRRRRGDRDQAVRPAESTRIKASGAGGQYVNKTESAIRITHVPTGIVVASQQERSQQQNRETAMQMLRAMIYERRQREQEEAMGTLRRSQVGTGDRSEKIRTYNFPQDRVTDHRINRNYGNIRGDHRRRHRSDRRGSLARRTRAPIGRLGSVRNLVIPSPSTGAALRVAPLRTGSVEGPNRNLILAHVLGKDRAWLVAHDVDAHAGAAACESRRCSRGARRGNPSRT